MDRLIIFNWNGINSNNQLSPYSERVLNILSQKYKLAIISKKNSRIAEIRILQTELKTPYFDILFASADKTADQYSRCMNKFSINPENTIIVGNGSIEDIDIGKSLGCNTYW